MTRDVLGSLADLTGNSADDIFAIGAGTGVPLALGIVTRTLTPSGADDSAAMIDALTNFAPFLSPVVSLGPGLFLWNTSVPAFARSQPARVIGSGVGKTTIKLSTGAPRAFDFNKIADGDTFNDIELSDFTVDANNVGGMHHVVLGTFQNGSVTSGTKTNFLRFSFRRIRTINVLVDINTGTNHRRNFLFYLNHPIAGDTLTMAKDFVFEDIRMEGGNCGIEVMGGGISTVGLNIFMDRIFIRRCWHSLLAPQPSQFGSANFQIGSRVQVGVAHIDDCYGGYSGDVGVEIDNADNCLVENTTIENAWHACFYHTNFNNPSNPATQKLTYRKCIARQFDNPNTASTVGLCWHTNVSLTVPLGHVELDDCLADYQLAYFPSGVGTAIEFQGLIPQITLNRTRVRMSAINWNSASAAVLVPIRLGSTHASSNVKVRNLSLDITATQASTGSLTVIGTQVVSATGVYDFDGIDWTSTQTGIAGASPKVIELNSTTLRGSLQRVRVLSHTGANLLAIFIRGTANLALSPPFPIENCDFTGMTGGTEVSFADNTNQPFVTFRNNKWRTFPKPSAAVSTSNFVTATFTTATGNRYIGGDMADIHFATGTGAGVTAIDVSKDGTTYENAYTQASGAMANSVLVTVDNGDYVKITFATTQPTVRVRPRR